MKFLALVATVALFGWDFETSYVDRNGKTQKIRTDCQGPPPLNETLCEAKHERKVMRRVRRHPPRLPPVKERTG